MAQITFHSMPDSAYLGTAMHVADEKGVSYDFVPLTYRSPEHLKLHPPFGKMPVMQHGDAYLYETLAITHYIDTAFHGPALHPAGALAQPATRYISRMYVDSRPNISVTIAGTTKTAKAQIDADLLTATYRGDEIHVITPAARCDAQICRARAVNRIWSLLPRCRPCVTASRAGDSSSSLAA